MSNVDREQLGEWLSAYLDGELNAEQNAIIERVLRDDPAAQSLLDDFRSQRAVLRSLPRRSAPDGLADDLDHAVERDMLLGGEHEDEPLKPQKLRHAGWSALATAAMFLVIVGGGTLIYIQLSGVAGVRESFPAVASKRLLAPEKAVRSQPSRPATTADLRLTPAETGRVTHEGSRESARHGTKGKPAGDGAADVAPLAYSYKDSREEAAGSERRTRSLRKGTEGDAGKLMGLAYTGDDGPIEADALLYEVDKTAKLARLAARANLEQKLEADFAEDEVLAHPFDNESNRLVIEAKTPQAGEAVYASVNDFIVTNLGEDLRRRSRGRNEAGAAELRRVSFYFAGQPTANFEPAGNEQQVLVRLPREQLPELVNDVNVAASPTEVRAKLQLGLMVANDGRQAEQLAQQVAQARFDQGDAAREEPGEPSPSTRPAIDKDDYPAEAGVFLELVNTLLESSPSGDESSTTEHAERKNDTSAPARGRGRNTNQLLARNDHEADEDAKAEQETRTRAGERGTSAHMKHVARSILSGLTGGDAQGGGGTHADAKKHPDQSDRDEAGGKDGESTGGANRPSAAAVQADGTKSSPGTPESLVAHRLAFAGGTERESEADDSKDANDQLAPTSSPGSSAAPAGSASGYQPAGRRGSEPTASIRRGGVAGQSARQDYITLVVRLIWPAQGPPAPPVGSAPPSPPVSEASPADAPGAMAATSSEGSTTP